MAQSNIKRQQHKQSLASSALIKIHLATTIHMILFLLASISHNSQLVNALVIDKQGASASQSINHNQQVADRINNDNVNHHDTKQVTINIFGESTTGQVKPNPAISQQTVNFQQRDYKRPIWNIAHMVNSIKELDYRLSKGANAVEADVTFNALGQPTFIYHGPPCDCWRHCHQQEDFDDYLAYVHEIALGEPSGIGRNLSLLFLDLKLDHLSHQAKERAGKELAQSVMDNLYPRHTPLLEAIDKNSRKKLRLIVSINHVTDVELVNNFIHHIEQNNATDLMKRIGFDVGMNDDIQQIEAMWRRFGKMPNGLNLWQGDGYTNCISPFYNLGRLSSAIAQRDNELGYPRKVYQWTVDLHDRIREAFMLGVDAIMTNHPERVLAVLSESEIAHNFRLATNDDDPFKKIPAKAIYRGNGGARYPRTISPISGGIMGSLMDVINSWVAYIREIPFLSLPTRLFTKMRRQFKFRSAPSDDRISYEPTTLHPVAYRASSIGSTQTISRSFDRQQNLPIVKLSTPNIITSSTTIQTSIQETNKTSPTTTSTSTQAPTTTSNFDLSDDSSIMTTTISKNNDKQIQAKDSSDSSEKLLVYDSPKWYTSMASNFLVSMLKLALPVNTTTMPTTTTAPTTTQE